MCLTFKICKGIEQNIYHGFTYLEFKSHKIIMKLPGMSYEYPRLSFIITHENHNTGNCV